jgi:hypothetical protein
VALDCTPVGPTARVYVALEPITPRTTVVRARLCLTVATRPSKVGSLQGFIRVDSSLARITRVQTVGPVVQSTARGTITLAAAAPRGLAGGTLLVITLRLMTQGVVPPLTLTMTEISGVDGRSLVSRTTIRGLPQRCAIGVRCTAPRTTTGTTACATVSPTSPPQLETLAPSEGSADPGTVIEATLTGCAFAPTGNTVRFGDVTMRNLSSTNGGTRITITIPKETPSTGEVPPMQIGPGRYAVTVTTPRGTSNVLQFTLR